MKTKTFKKKYNYRPCLSCQTCAHRGLQAGKRVTCTLMDYSWEGSVLAVCDKHKLSTEAEKAIEEVEE